MDHVSCNRKISSWNPIILIVITEAKEINTKYGLVKFYSDRIKQVWEGLLNEIQIFYKRAL
jgi:hypothetical protein